MTRTTGTISPSNSSISFTATSIDELEDIIHPVPDQPTKTDRWYRQRSEVICGASEHVGDLLLLEKSETWHTFLTVWHHALACAVIEVGYATDYFKQEAQQDDSICCTCPCTALRRLITVEDKLAWAHAVVGAAHRFHQARYPKRELRAARPAP